MFSFMLSCINFISLSQLTFYPSSQRFKFDYLSIVKTCKMTQSSHAAKVFVRQVKPLLSLDHAESQKRVRNLYRAWYRQIPLIVHDFHVPKNADQCRARLREEFEKNRGVQDIRVIDMLVVKGQLELKEVVNKWKQECHLMMYFKDSWEPKPKDFLSKFVSGSE